MNADVFVEEEVIDILLECEQSPVFLSDSSRIQEADYKFYWEQSRLIQFGKHLTPEQTTGNMLV